MVLTRLEAKAAFTHVLDTVLGRGDGTQLKTALTRDGFEDIFAFSNMSQQDIDHLGFPDPNDASIILPINRGDIGLVQCFIDFILHKEQSGSPIDDWTALQASEFDAFRISPVYIAARRNPTAPAMGGSAPTATAPATPTSRSLSSVEIFRRGIKRDPTLFPTLKDEKFNDNWHRSFETQARAQGVHQVLDPTFVPTSHDDMELFDEQQKYVYAVLESKVLTDRGKAIVRTHETDFNAQAVYKKLREHHLQSTKASIESSTILSYITSARLGNGEWQGTTEAFILHWQNQVRMYERLIPSSAHFSGDQKRIMLENSVAPVEELRQVKINADYDKAKTGDALGYDKYVSLLLSAAISYDSQHLPKRTTGRRQVYNHELLDNDPDSEFPEHHSQLDDYDIDLPVQTLQSYAHDRRPNQTPKKPGKLGQSPRMSWEKWKALSDKDQKVWDQLDDKAKAIILGISTPSSAPSKPRINLHEISAHDFLQANLHDLDASPVDVPTPVDDDVFQDPIGDPSPPTDLLVNAATSGSSGKLVPGDIRKVMSKTSKSTVNANFTNIVYTVSSHQYATSLSLIDRGANGGVAGSDVRVIFKTHRTVDIRGIDNHQVTNIDIGTVGGVVQTQKGQVIAIMHQYALLGKGSSIHSPCQLEWYKNDVNDKSIHAGGLQRIKTLDGFVIPLAIKEGLVRLDIRPYTDHEWESLPHVFLTSETEWDPTVLDHDLLEDEQWFDAVSDPTPDPLATSPFDEFGNYRHHITVQKSFQELLDDNIEKCIYAAHHQTVISCYNALVQDADVPQDNVDHPLISMPPRLLSTKAPDYASLRPLFGWLSTDTIKKTFENTTQYARLPTGTLLKRHFQSPNPALNVHRRDEAVACDIVYSDEPAVDDGSTSAVIFVGVDTQVTDIYGIKSDKQFIRTLEDNIRQRGAPNKLLSDRGSVEISNKVHDVLRTLCIGDWQSEPHQQQQNPAERRFQTLKTATNRVMDRSGAPACTWLLALTYVCYLLNHTYNSTISSVPLQQLTGSTIDISPLLRFHFWQKVYYKHGDSSFPSESTEGLGHIVGISEHCGHAMTWKILTADTKKIIFRSLVRPFSDSDPNIRADLSGGEEESSLDPSLPIIKSKRDLAIGTKQNITDVDGEAKPESPPIFHPEDLVGRTFLLDEQKDGQKHRAKIVKMSEDHETSVEENPTRLKFVLSVNNDKAEEIITYNKLLEYLAHQEEDDVLWKFRRITSHQGPLKPNHPDYKGSTYNVMIEWETGEITSEPLQLIAADDPVTCAIYARDNDLLNLPGWKRFKSLAKRQKKFTRAVNQAKLRSYNTSPRYKYGFEVPRNYAHALRLDEKNKNKLWQNAIALELLQIQEYKTFKDYGHHTKSKPPDKYKKIRVHFVFDVKHDGRHKARLVADGHLTDIPLDSVYSGVVSLRGFRLTMFLAELNKLELWATDIGNAYLEAKTSEQVYIIAGPEFGELEGHILVVVRALYGLRSSGARWHDRFADCLRDMGFSACKAEPDIWLKDNGGIYEYIAVYVDDLAIAMKDPQSFITTLESKYNFKLKGTGPISYHLGMDFERDKDGVLCIAPRKYIEKMISSYQKFFGEAPKQNVSSPLEKGDHPELDTSELLDSEGITIYQSLIGALQWVVSIGRFDVNTAVMTLSGFRAAPRKGHMDRVKRIYGYLSKMRHASIRIRVEEPDYSDIPDFQYDWSQTIYGNLEELKPDDAPVPQGKYVTLTHYVDANLMHDVITGRSVTGILHLANKTPIDWYSKKQATVETATYGSEFVAARTCVEQIIDLRTTLRYLGVPIRDKSYMFGDNKSVVDSSMQVHSKLHKRHTILSYHRVRETIAAGMVGFYFINGEHNPADILSKHWGYSQVWTQLRALLFWTGDTAFITDSNESCPQSKGE
jgi:Reverse transcriptase (RNA-dependent DNA polymerase)